MKLKEKIKHAISFILHGEPDIVVANISVLAPSDLLKERWAIITGGSSGIGYSIAKAFLDAGASVIITGRNKERLENARHSLNCPGRVFYFVLDNSNVSSFPSTFQRMLACAEEKNGQISILVNNAGVGGATLPNASEKDYDKVMNTNLKGVFFLSQMIGKYMKERNIKGNILNIASSSCIRPANSAYALSKWSVRGFTLGLAKSLIPYGIVVNGVAPGPTATPMMGRSKNDNLIKNELPLGRYILPEEIANISVFLVSNMGRAIIGDMVYASGGAGIIKYDDMPYPF